MKWNHVGTFAALAALVIASSSVARAFGQPAVVGALVGLVLAFAIYPNLNRLPRR